MKLGVPPLLRAEHRDVKVQSRVCGCVELLARLSDSLIQEGFQVIQKTRRCVQKVTELGLIFRPSDFRVAEVEFHLSHKHLCTSGVW
jgi:hypothetical protein